jgi:hypothetical protein
MKITLDNGRELKCTPDHCFPIWGKGKTQAQDLKINDSIISFNMKEKKLGNCNYTKVFDHEKNEWIYSDRMVAEYFKDDLCKQHDSKTDGDFNTIHHIDFNSRNNNPDNLLYKDLSSKNISNKNDKHFKTEYKNHNHRIVKIEYLKEREDTGTLTIDQNHEYHDYHTFALDAGVFTYNSFWFCKPEGSSGTTVSTVGNSVSWTELPDLEYFQKKLFMSLKVPLDRFKNPSVDIKRAETISAEEYRFAKFIMRLLDRFSIGLTRGFITHLKLIGVWDNFKLTDYDIKLDITPPASFSLYEAQKLLKIKFDNYDTVTKDHDEL